MRKALYIYAGLIMVGLLISSKPAEAQGGCFFPVYFGQVDCTGCGGLGSQPSWYCEGDPTYEYFCSQGYGTCCDTEFGTTSMTFDPRCGLTGHLKKLKPDQLTSENYLIIAFLYVPGCAGGYT